MAFTADTHVHDISTLLQVFQCDQFISGIHFCETKNQT